MHMPDVKNCDFMNSHLDISKNNIPEAISKY
jgi:hypothetical protein